MSKNRPQAMFDMLRRRILDEEGNTTSRDSCKGPFNVNSIVKLGARS